MVVVIKLVCGHIGACILSILTKQLVTSFLLFQATIKDDKNHEDAIFHLHLGRIIKIISSVDVYKSCMTRS